MYATVFLILVRQRRRARAPLTLCAQCRHKYAIYASVWPAWARVGGTCVSVHMFVYIYARDVRCVRACVCVCVYICGRMCVFEYMRESGTTVALRKTCHTRVTSRAHVRVYCMAKRGPMFSPAVYLDSLRSARFLPWILFVFRTAQTLPSYFHPRHRRHRGALFRSYLSATIAVIYDLGWWI